MALNAAHADAYCAGMAGTTPATARGRDSTEPGLDMHDQLVADLISALAQGLTMPLAARSCAVSVRTAHRRLAAAIIFVARAIRVTIELVAVGSTTPAIALQLGIAAATVESHLRNARLKLGADTRWQAVAAASERCGGGT